MTWWMIVQAWNLGNKVDKKCLQMSVQIESGKLSSQQAFTGFEILVGHW